MSATPVPSSTPPRSRFHRKGWWIFVAAVGGVTGGSGYVGVWPAPWQPPFPLALTFAADGACDATVAWTSGAMHWRGKTDLYETRFLACDAEGAPSAMLTLPVTDDLLVVGGGGRANRTTSDARAAAPRVGGGDRPATIQGDLGHGGGHFLSAHASSGTATLSAIAGPTGAPIVAGEARLRMRRYFAADPSR